MRELRFSALQRAENSSIYKATKVVNINEKFQCSSASRKFLNQRISSMVRSAATGFSALQRAENSSILWYYYSDAITDSVSVLFSEPKIPQLPGCSAAS